MLDNVDVLTHSHQVLKKKRRTKNAQIDNITFDEAARREYLTGFRKRNLLKKEAAKAKAKERERQLRLQSRREQRDALHQQATSNAKFVEKAYRDKIKGPADNEDDSGHESDSDDALSGFASSADKGKARESATATEDAYEDNLQFASVTIVHEFDPTNHQLLHPTDSDSDTPTSASLHVQNNPERSSNSVSSRINQPHHHPSNAVTSNPSLTKPSHKHAPVNVKPKKIAYETKAARKAARVKQRARRSEKAQLAGGKSRRKEKGKTKRGKH